MLEQVASELVISSEDSDDELEVKVQESNNMTYAKIILDKK